LTLPFARLLLFIDRPVNLTVKINTSYSSYSKANAKFEFFIKIVKKSVKAFRKDAYSAEKRKTLEKS